MKFEFLMFFILTNGAVATADGFEMAATPLTKQIDATFPISQILPIQKQDLKLSQSARGLPVIQLTVSGMIAAGLSKANEAAARTQIVSSQIVKSVRVTDIRVEFSALDSVAVDPNSKLPQVAMYDGAFGGAGRAINILTQLSVEMAPAFDAHEGGKLTVERVYNFHFPTANAPDTVISVHYDPKTGTVQ